MSEQAAASEKRVFQALDLDRTLLNTSVLELKLRQTVAKFDAKLAVALEEESDAFSARGESFPIFRYLRQQLGPDYLAYVEYLKQEITPQDILNEGATERLAYAEKYPAWSGGILTYGDPAGQALKLELTGLRAYPHIITDTHEKGALFASWQLPDGSYQLPDEFDGRVVDIVTLDDDKLTAFNHLPKDHAFGVWLTNQADAAEKIPAALSKRVVPVRHLRESMQRLEAFLTTD